MADYSDSDSPDSGDSPTNGPRNRKRKINIPSWRDRMNDLIDVLVDRGQLKPALHNSSSIEEVLFAARSEVEIKRMQLELLQTKLEMKNNQLVRARGEKRKSHDSSASNASSAPSSTHYLPPISPPSPASDHSGSLSDTSSSSGSVASSNQLTSLVPSSHPRNNMIASVPRGIDSPQRFLNNLSHSDGIQHAPFPFFCLSPGMRVLECNDAFIDDLKFVHSKMVNLNLMPETPIPSREIVTRNQPTIFELFDAFHAHNPAKTCRIMENIGKALAQGFFSSVERPCPTPTGEIYSLTITFWTTYEQSADGQTLWNKPRYVNCLKLSQRRIDNPAVVRV